MRLHDATDADFGWLLLCALFAGLFLCGLCALLNSIRLYCRGNGLGRRLMSLLHVVAAKLDLDAVMLTVFKANAAAQRFYVEKLKYAVDGDDPANHGVDDACYVILSRPLKRALAPSN